MSTTELSATPRTPPAGRPVRHRPHLLLGGLLVKEGLINRVQLERVLSLQGEIEPRPLLGRLLVDEKLITPHELDVVLDKYHKAQRLGNVLVELSVITPAQLETALAHQRTTDGLLGAVLIQLGFITERQLKQALCVQLKLTFVDLDDWFIDPTLSSLISERYARRHRVLPIARVDERIVLAMEDPTDVELVAELRSCIAQRIEVVAVTADALDRAFARLSAERRDVAVVPGSPPGQDETARHVPPEGAPLPVLAPASEAPVSSGPDAPDGKAPERARLGVTFDAMRTRMTAVRQLVRSWERATDALEGLLRERAERRAAIDRLGGELRESQAAHASTSRELEAKTRALASLETAHAAVTEERDALTQSLAELRQRHEALLRDRALTVDQLDAILHRLRP